MSFKAIKLCFNYQSRIKLFDIKIHMKPNTFDHNKMLDSTNNLINLFEDLVLTSLIQNSTFLCNVIRFQLYFLLNDEHEKEMNPILNGIKTNYWPL